MAISMDLRSRIDELIEGATATLSADAASEIDELVASIEVDDLEAAADATVARLPERGVHPGLHYLLARLRQRLGARDVAQDLLARVLERINQDGDFEALIALLDRTAALVDVETAIPLIVRAHRETGGKAVPAAMIEEWIERYPDDPRLAWLAGLSYMAAGDPRAAGQLARALEFLAREGGTGPDELESAALPVLEALDSETAPAVTAMLRELLAQRRHDETITYLDLSLDALLASGQAAELWNILRPALAAGAPSALRAPALAALAALHAEQPRFGEVVAKSGLADDSVPFATALARYERIIRLPPGAFVEHTSWGVGEILDVEENDLVLRFAGRPAHAMGRDLAERVLDRRDADDLRVLRVFFHDRLVELRDRDPAALVVAALKSLGGEGKPRDLRRVLTAGAIETAAWADWWRATRNLLADDPRLDVTQVFRDVYRLAEISASDDTGVPPPHLDDRDDPARQVRILRRFLSQHPDSREQAVRMFTRRLDGWLARRSLSPGQRLLLELELLAWHPDEDDRRRRLVAELVSACAGGFDISELTDPGDQARLLDLGLAEADWRPVAVAALDSRLTPLRERARAAIEQRLAGDETAALYRELLTASPARGDAVLEVATGALDGATAALSTLPIIDVFLALLALVSEPERESLRNRALRLLAPNGPVFGRLRAHERPANEVDRVAMGVLGFRASDSLLNPLLVPIEQIWGPAASAALHRRRQQEGELIAARMDDDSGFPTVLYMTRRSHARLQAEVERVQLELRTTIPRAIQKARELGDLRENAEYESAKLKQQQYNDRLALLTDRLAQAAVIEDADVDGATVTVGTEVSLTMLDEEGGSRIVWILGYDDGGHGDHVVSYQSDLGRSLWRHRVGDEVDVPGPGTSRRGRIAAIRVRMPEE